MPIAGGGAPLACAAAIVSLTAPSFGVWQTVAAQQVFTGANVVAMVVLGLVSSALTSTLLAHGIRYVKVRQSFIVGLRGPVSAPLYAYVFLAQQPSVWTLAGGR